MGWIRVDAVNDRGNTVADIIGTFLVFLHGSKGALQGVIRAVKFQNLNEKWPNFEAPMLREWNK